jgi:hypothetical protein
LSAIASQVRAQRQEAQQPERDGVHLDVVRPKRRPRRRHRGAPLLAAGLVSTSLFAVIVGHAELAQEQVKLAAVESAVTAAQVVHRHEVVSVANLQNPTRILRDAEAALHMVTPGKVEQVPHVTLGVALATPKVSPSTSASVPSSP